MESYREVFDMNVSRFWMWSQNAGTRCYWDSSWSRRAICTIRGGLVLIIGWSGLSPCLCLWFFLGLSFFSGIRRHISMKHFVKTWYEKVFALDSFSPIFGIYCAISESHGYVSARAFSADVRVINADNACSLRALVVQSWFPWRWITGKCKMATVEVNNMTFAKSFIVPNNHNKTVPNHLLETSKTYWFIEIYVYRDYTIFILYFLEIFSKVSENEVFQTCPSSIHFTGYEIKKTSKQILVCNKLTNLFRCFSCIQSCELDLCFNKTAANFGKTKWLGCMN